MGVQDLREEGPIERRGAMQRLGYRVTAQALNPNPYTLNRMQVQALDLSGVVGLPV